MAICNESNLKQLYNSGKSMKQISIILNCSEHKIVYWMSKYGIKRRSWSEATYVMRNPNGDPFSIKNSLTEREKVLFGLGLGLYWGEGEKHSKNGIRVANSDPGIIKLFREFLLNICQLEKRKLFYSIVCFNDSDIQEVEKFWAKQLGTTQGKFGKIVQIPPQGKGNYKRKSRFGVCTLTVSNPKLKAWIMNEIEKMKMSADIV